MNLSTYTGGHPAAETRSESGAALARKLSRLCRTHASRAPGERAIANLLSNLVDNALRYCNNGSRVRVSCRRDDKELLLMVDDSGPGLDADQRERAPGRFYRAGDTNLAGAGLGLSIVKTIAQSHGGQMQLSESVMGGLCVSLRFQIA